ncbi:MAG: 4Fe-4S dicluster domain-containing protein [Ignavibacteria bacterium]|nr:MAG: 4Fe-4S dicluster domain-containing protein [Ignavibacteria bacterium]
MPKWGMVIDLDKCTGCGACTSACKLENNIAIVDPKEANKGRVMFWMDMMSKDYGDYPDIKTKRIPKSCYHCDNPPCTKVCPVHATYKNEEGLVGQVYHRCIGCRYCMAACPYTAKVFNWFEPVWEGDFDKCHNPDVSLRMKGVVEKCSFCAHRLIRVKEDAAAEERELADGDYTTACQENCPADAIYFGDLEDKNSKVYKMANSPRAQRMMEDLGTEPKVIYLAYRE